MTTYGTIPAESHPSSNLRIISNAKESIESNLGTRRPWKEMMQLESFKLPASFDELVERIKTNNAYFRYNYVVIIIFILFFSLLWNPISLIFFIIMMAAWLFLYFLRESPLVVFGIVLHDNAVMSSLLAITVMVLLLTNVSDNIIIALFIGAAMILIHGSFRNTDDLMYIGDEEGFGSVGILRRVDNQGIMPLKNAASPSFSAS